MQGGESFGQHEASTGEAPITRPGDPINDKSTEPSGRRDPLIEVDPSWSLSVVVCCNQRSARSRRGCCGRDAGQALRHWLRDRARAEGVREHVVVHGGHCMDVCGAGTTVALHVGGRARRVFVVPRCADEEEERRARESLWREVAEVLERGTTLGGTTPER